MKYVSVHSFKEIIDSESNNTSVDFINVCTPAEYKEKHIRGVRSMPLDTIEEHLSEFKDKKTIYVHCRSGRRAEAAIEKLASLGVAADLINVEGGLLSWEESGYETNSSHVGRAYIPIMRQVFIAAAFLILLGLALSYLIHPWFIGITIFVAIGLLFSGLTGWCGMAFVLGKMPWNK